MGLLVLLSANGSSEKGSGMLESKLFLLYIYDVLKPSYLKKYFRQFVVVL
jgi:hypothetical protein